MGSAFFAPFEIAEIRRGNTERTAAHSAALIFLRHCVDNAHKFKCLIEGVHGTNTYAAGAALFCPEFSVSKCSAVKTAPGSCTPRSK